ncbi:ATP-binding cassette domain-containing protein [uncultured Mailhella sp.]|uniref:methionine ABC transporter ATP-binding protein n=1 Tax=uncultured Mailhella sp. TaxID=1981031 RepID=UPI002605599A|nr:ATP-binding cassette domain-containing protein [uncultured Mailhella sp.]
MAEPIISIRGLEKKFQSKNSEVYALKGINLDIHQGDIFGIIGRSGAGKSTLVRCINMLERPTGGQVLFEGKDLCRLPECDLREARRSMGMIFQQFNLLMQRTAEENVCFPLELTGTPRETARKRAAELLELVGLSKRASSYPSQLSGGQKQRVAIARALATNPKVLLCDEATSALDPSTTASILALIKDINRRLGITAVVITHEMSVIEKICSHVAIIAGGKIAETGPVEEVFYHPRTEAARTMVMPEALDPERLPQGRVVRIVFTGSSSLEPVIGNMILDCGRPLSILYSDLREIDGAVCGQMVLQLPDDAEACERIYAFAASRGLELEDMKHV